MAPKTAVPWSKFGVKTFWTSMTTQDATLVLNPLQLDSTVQHILNVLHPSQTRLASESHSQSLWTYNKTRRITCPTTTSTGQQFQNCCQITVLLQEAMMSYFQVVHLIHLLNFQSLSSVSVVSEISQVNKKEILTITQKLREWTQTILFVFSKV